MRTQYPLTREKASFAKYLVLNLGWSQTKAALRLQLNQGSVSRAVHGVCHPDVLPRDPDAYEQPS